MTLLAWNDRYAVGDASVDHEHRELIDLINRLHAELMAGDPEEDVEGFLGDLHRGISAHFALEEALMRARRYDQYAAHKADHERLLDEIRDIMEDSRDADLAAASAALAERLDAWFSTHFATHDARLHGRLGGQHPGGRE
jgi:hemerythrin-like metal-binding protein